MRTETVNIYRFSELSPEAQQKAIADYYRDGDYHWDSENYATREAFEGMIELTDNNRDLSGIRLMAYLWNNYGHNLYEGKYYSTGGKWIDGKYNYKKRYSKCQFVCDCPLTGYGMDMDILKPFIEAMHKPYKWTFADLYQECLDAWQKAYDADITSQQTVEYFADHAEANNYEYYENGEQY